VGSIENGPWSGEQGEPVPSRREKITFLHDLIARQAHRLLNACFQGRWPAWESHILRDFVKQARPINEIDSFNVISFTPQADSMLVLSNMKCELFGIHSGAKTLKNVGISKRLTVLMSTFFG
jgi:hypothetical protein